jgi:hypothetical protein
MEHGLSMTILEDRPPPAIVRPLCVFSSNAAAVQQLLEDVGPPVSDVRLMMGEFVELDPGSAGANARSGRDCQRTGCCPNGFDPSVAGDWPGGVRVELAIVAFSVDAGIVTTVTGAAM